MLALFTACHKDHDNCPQNPNTPVYENYLPLKVGNYWVYQQFRVDSDGTENATNIIDSCYIEKDTAINGMMYYKYVRPNYLPDYSITFIHDSLHYIVNSAGVIQFSSMDFTTVFDTRYVYAAPGDTACQLIHQMYDQPVQVITPLANYTTLDSRITLNFYNHWAQHGTPRYQNTNFAKDLGIVSEVLPLFASDPGHTVRKLIRFHLN